MGDLRELLDLRSVRSLAGEASFARGLGYLEDGLVRSLRSGDREVAATVDGTSTYSVRLLDHDGALSWSCSCPMGDDGHFCKHCVAVALAFTGEFGDLLEAAAAPVDEVRSFLRGQPPARLVELVLEQATIEPRLWDRILLEMAQERANAEDPTTLRAVIDEVLTIDGFVPYRYAHHHAQRVHDVVDVIEELMVEHPDQVIDLCERALQLGESALELIDDSDGAFGEVFARLQDLHHQACRRARPDPIGLARRLFAWAMDSSWGFFLDALDTYADALGDEGVAEYRRLAEQRWSKVPRLSPDEKAPFDSDRFHITHLMERLAEGDLEAMIEVRARDLSSPYSFLQIAEHCREADEDDLALEWAERGMQAFGEHTDPRLRTFLADELRRRHRHDEAVDLAWSLFTDRPTLESYQLLNTHASSAGTWQQWRERALSHLRDRTAQARRGAEDRRAGSRFAADHSVLVEIHLWEGDPDIAWQVAQEGGCSEDLWMALAEARAADHPQDAVDVYKHLVNETLSVADKRHYERAVRLLERIEELLVGQDRDEEFIAYVGRVREAHKRKKNLLKLLDQKRWS